MWYEKQFRDNGNLTTLLQAIRQIATFPIRIMEVCGGQTYALSRYSEHLLCERGNKTKASICRVYGRTVTRPAER